MSISTAYSNFTFRDEKEGFPATKKALQDTPTKDLVREYCNGMMACFDKFFGCHARKFQTLIANELISRGITEIQGMFGPIKIQKWEW